jgi:hypothetical protein
MKDRIWNTKLKLTGPQIINLDLDNEIYLENIEPKEKKSIFYNIIATEDIPDPLKIVEKTEISNIENTFKDNLEKNFAGTGDEKYLLVFGRENILKFTITIENISTYIFHDINFVKNFSEDFYDLKSMAEIKFKNRKLEWQIPKLMPNEKIQLIFHIKTKPIKKENIGTGNIELSGKISSLTTNILSGIEIDNFSAYSHVRHSTRIKEDKDEQNKWECSLNFKNNSEFEIKLKSILVLDELKNKKFIDLELEKHISPGDSYSPETWKVENKAEPKFLRKVNYSVVYEIKNYGKVQMTIDQNLFDFVDIHFKKKFTESFLVQSASLMLEESRIENLIRVRNIGTTPINAIIIKERISEDFLLPTGSSKFQIKHSSGKFYYDNFEIMISPDNTINSNFFILEIFINLNQNKTKCLLDIDEFLEIKYPLSIISPDYKKEYIFPTEITSYFSKYKEIENQVDNNLYINKHILPIDLQPSLKVGHHRQYLEIDKSIYPGQNKDEFEIYLNINNISKVPAKNLNLIDIFPKSFEFISSNIENKIIDVEDDEGYRISFKIESILPDQETKIKYYIRNISSKNIDYSELESFIFELGNHFSPALLESFKDDKLSIETKKIDVINEESLQFQYDNNGILKNLSGNGVITVKNNSTKDQVWNVQLELSGSQLVNLDLEKNINFGIINPETGKNINYDVKSTMKIPNPLKISEETDIINIDTQEIKATASYLNTQRIVKLSKKKKLDEKEVQDKFNEYFNSIKSRLGMEQENLDESIKIADEWILKENKLKETVNTLKKERDIVLTAKSNALSAKLKQISGKNELTKTADVESSIDAIRNQINAKRDEITEIEEESLKKEASLKKELDAKYDPQIKETENSLTNQEAALSEATEIFEKLMLKSKKLKSSLKNLKKEHKRLIKTKSKVLKKKLKEISRGKKNKLKQSQNQTSEKITQIEEEFSMKEASAKKEIERSFSPKIKEKEAKLTSIGAELSEVTLKIEEWRLKKENLEVSVKNLKDEHINLVIEKSKYLNKELTVISEEKKSKIKEIESQIFEKEEKIIKIKERAAKEAIVAKEIEDEYGSQINSIESRLSVEQSNLDETINKVNEWSTKKKELTDIVKSLKEEYKTLIKKQLKDSENFEVFTKKKKHILILGMENILKFTITIENISQFIFQNVRFIKKFSKDFYDFKSTAGANFENGELEWEIPILKPGDKKELTFHIKTSPIKKDDIGTGSIEVYGVILSSTNNFLSGIKVDYFSAYSHALHTIFIKENKNKNNKKEYMLIFRNNSEFNMNLNSILVLDESKNKKFIDIELEKPISPRETFISKTWEVENKTNPKFFRKVNYSVVYEIENYGKVQMTIDQSIFDIIDIQFEREFSESFLVQSASLMLEESRIENLIHVRNIGTTPIDGIIIKEVIPKDFILPTRKSIFQIKSSSGKTSIDNFEVKISPPNKDPSVQHILELFINLNENMYMYQNFLDVNEVLEIKYPLSINSPNFLKKYEFEIEITFCFSKYQNIKSLETEDFYYKKHILPIDIQPSLRVGHYRQYLEIKKSIYPGQNKDEVEICLNINNISKVPAKNINLIDVFQKSFEFIFSNIKQKITDADCKDHYAIYFNIESILPNIEKEIKYYIRNISGKHIDYSELESYIYG